MKPSEAIAAKLPELRQQLTTVALNVAAEISGYQFTLEDRAEFEASEDGKKMAQHIEPAVVAGATIAYLDEEQARREKFEAEALGRLEKLEKGCVALPEAVAFAQRAVAAASEAFVCSKRLPAPEQRVLAFVPSQPEGRRWRVAQWCAPPAQYTDESWRDEESMVGDESYRWRPDQVTHWMPMPGEPK